MLNYVWITMIVFGFFIGAMNGRISDVTEAAISSADSAVKLAVSLLGAICMWTGIMSIARKSGLINHLSKFIQPALSLVFPNTPKGHPALGAIVMNVVANTLGLGNAATPLGINAMHELQKINNKKTVASDEMCTFIILSATCLQIIPTTVIALRSAAGSLRPSEIISTVWVTSLCTMVTGIIAAKTLPKLFKSEK